MIMKILCILFLRLNSIRTKSHIDSLVKTSKLVEKHFLFIKKMQRIKEKVKPNIYMVEVTVVPHGLCMTYRALLDKYINRAKRFG